MSSDVRKVLVLSGGPDSEREVSLRSGRTIVAGLREVGFEVVDRPIERISLDELRAMPGDVVFPALHGGWGEGGPLQDLLEADGRPFVGSRAKAARLAMDKIATKFVARGMGIPTPEAFVLDDRDGACPLPLPAVLKPVHDGSTVGLFVCREEREWDAALRTISQAREHAGDSRAYMVERCVCREGGRRARELTVGVLDGNPLPVIEIAPAVELYDYEAKYNRNDTRYTVAPPLPAGVTERIQKQTAELARAMGVRHLARADFMLDGDGPDATAWFLEINTMPGFTDHSLVPMACRHQGLTVAQVVKRLVEMAVRDGAPRGADAQGRGSVRVPVAMQGRTAGASR